MVEALAVLEMQYPVALPWLLGQVMFLQVE
jgi:hypothetical protein